MPITVNGETYYTETEAREKFSIPKAVVIPR